MCKIGIWHLASGNHASRCCKAASDVFVCGNEMDRQLGEAKKSLKPDDDGEEDENDKRQIAKYVPNRKETERQLLEAKKGLADASRDGQAAAARIRALHAELEEVRFF